MPTGILRGCLPRAAFFMEMNDLAKILQSDAWWFLVFKLLKYRLFKP